MQIGATESKIEAVLFAGGEPVEAARLAQALDIDAETLDKLIRNIRARYEETASPFDILSLGDSYQMCTRDIFAPIIREALEFRRNQPLSQAAMEVLAIVAYNQPVTRAFIDQIRGVDCGALVRGLTEKGLLEEAGRLSIPGRPISYRTTSVFLRCFGLNCLDDLPPIPSGEESGGIPAPEDQLTVEEVLEDRELSAVP